MDAVLTSQPEPEGRLHGVVPTHVLIYITCSHRKGLTKAIGGAQPKSVQQRPALQPTLRPTLQRTCHHLRGGARAACAAASKSCRLNSATFCNRQGGLALPCRVALRAHGVSALMGCVRRRIRQSKPLVRRRDRS